MAIIVASAIILSGIALFLLSYNSYIDKMLYAERLSQMREVTTQLFSGLEDVVKNEWRMVNEQCNSFENEDIRTKDDFLAYMRLKAQQGDFDFYLTHILAIDEDGIYYSDDEKQGFLGEREMLYAQPEQISFVSNSLTYDETRMVFLKRLDNPINIKDNGRTISIRYYGITQSMESLNPYFQCSAYNGNNSVYVVDDKGLKLFSSGNDNYLKGFNVYTILGNLNYLHKSTFDVAYREMTEHSVAYSNAVVDGTEIYYALYHMENAAWTLIFLVPSEYVAMNAIIGMTKLMEYEKDDVNKLDTYLKKIDVSSQHLLSVINDVLDMSKIESGDVTLNLGSVRLADEITQVENIIRPQAESHGHKFTVCVHELVHEFIIYDAVRLRQAIINLLSNAVKYTHDGGEIFYNIEELPCNLPDKAKIKFSVTDNGYGMTPEFLEHIFEPFVRVENSTTNKVQGTGLGMAITKKIVDLMGGTISINSEIGRGSCFEITAVFSIDNKPQYDLQAKNILIVSDDEPFVKNIQAAFKERNQQLFIASDISGAAGIIKSQSVEIVLLNNYVHCSTLPDDIRALRESKGGNLLIFCCDYAEPEQEIDNVRRCGADGLIDRPFFFSKLINAVNEAQLNTQQPKIENKGMLSGIKFLCAEDNERNAEILGALLKIEGAECEIYPDGEALVSAFDGMKAGDFDVILMDIQMPKMNGIEAARAIRNGDNPLGKNIPIIAMTANAFSSDVQECLDAGMNAHISKPLDIPLLEKTVRKLLDIQ